MSKIKTFTQTLKFTAYTLGIYSIGVWQGSIIVYDRAQKEKREELERLPESVWEPKPKELNDRGSGPYIYPNADWGQPDTYDEIQQLLGVHKYSSD